jgi:hypothetical protein
VDQVEFVFLVGNLELAQRLGHQVGNAKATQFKLLHLVVGGIELFGLLLDPHPTFVSEALLRSPTKV